MLRGAPRGVKHNEIKDEAEIKNLAVSSGKLAANAVTYAKLDANGRRLKFTVRREVTDVAATDFEIPLMIADVAGTLVSAKVVGGSGIGQATNYSSLAVINKGAAGAGTTNMASYAFDNGTTHALTAYVPLALTNDGTPANLNFVAGDVITLKKTHTASGQALPSILLVEVVIERTA